MKLRFGGWMTVAAVMAMVLALGGPAKAGEMDRTSGPGPSEGHAYSLHLYHLHTGESLDVVYRVGDTYIPSALDELNHFLRDHRTETIKAYDPKEFDLLYSLMAKLGRPNGVIDIVCGYRTPWSNHFLRTRAASTGVAEHSQHMQAKAIDIRVPGVSTLKLRNAALSLNDGGVGYYPVSHFVHVDVGPVREWSYGRVRSRRLHSRAHARMRVAGD
jgi:uncharacterized protein YcbK (DUF882 family)